MFYDILSFTRGRRCSGLIQSRLVLTTQAWKQALPPSDSDNVQKNFLMKYANSANGLCQLFGIGALWEYYSCVFFVLFIACFSTTIPYLWWNKVVYCMRKANKYHKISGESNTKVIRNPYPGQDHHQNLTPFRGSPLAHAMHHMFGRRPLPQPWVILLTERQTERPITLLRQPWRRKNIYQH